MFPVGAPDGGYPPSAGTASQIDTSALGDRLLMGGGSAIKTGRIIWATGFENGQPTDFNILGTAVGDNPKIILGSFGALAWQGNYALSMTPANVVNENSRFQKPYPASLSPGKWGIEVMVLFNSIGQCDFDINFSKGAPAGGTVLFGKIRIAFISTDNSNVQLQYKNAAGVFIQFGDVSGAIDSGGLGYYNLKWVPDWPGRNYGAFYYNGFKYDLSTAAIETTGSGGSESSFVDFTFTTLTTAFINQVLIDNVILTADEP